LYQKENQGKVQQKEKRNKDDSVKKEFKKKNDQLRILEVCVVFQNENKYDRVKKEFKKKNDQLRILEVCVVYFKMKINIKYDIRDGTTMKLECEKKKITSCEEVEVCGHPTMIMKTSEMIISKN